jgi:hypothetical protein
MTKLGRCCNFGNCTLADSCSEIEIIGSTLVCPECGGSIIKITTGIDNKIVSVISNSILYEAFLLFLIAFATPIVFILLQSAEEHNLNLSLPNDNPVLSTCTFSPIKIPTKPNWYAVIQIGSKGVKSIAVEFQPTENDDLIPKTFHSLGTQDVTPQEELNVPHVVKAICESINMLHAEYGKLPVYIVGSSSMELVAHRAKLESAITKAIQLPVEFLNADQEVSYLAKGTWARPLPIKRYCESVVIDLGSSNINGGYLENCNPSKESHETKVVTFNIPDLGTIAFSKETAKEVTETVTFNEAAIKTRENLEAKIDEQVSSRPELINGKKRIYLVGGAAWALNTLLCLDCPQYRERYITDDQDEYTVIKPTDIDEFYKFVTQKGNQVCDKNPYINRNLDGNSTRHLEEGDVEKQKEKNLNVCSVFTNSDLISAAEILRAIAKKMEINQNRHLFFMQNNFFTWSKQYLIEKIEQHSQLN